MMENDKEQKTKLKKKKRRRQLDKEKLAESKRRTKARKKRMKEQVRQEKQRIREEKKRGKLIEESLTSTESVTVNESGVLERTITVEETYTIEESAGARKKKPDRRKMAKTAAICAAAFLVLGGGFSYWLTQYLAEQSAQDAVVEAMLHTEAVELTEYSSTQHKKDALKQNAGKNTAQTLVDAAKYMLEGIGRRPPEVRLTEADAEKFSEITDCLINSETGKVDVTMKTDKLALSDDGYYYLFALQSCAEGITDEEYIIEEEKDTELTFSVNLNYNTVGSRLFSKFVVAIKQNGEYLAVSKPHYITNPEAVARYNPSFISTTSKKGILVDPEKLHGSELDDLGVRHAAYNIPLSRILGNTTNAYYPTVYYTYNGRTYSFNGQVVAEYDFIFSTLSNKKITTTGIILNDIHPGYMELIHPKARDGGGNSQYYAFNAAETEGIEYIAAVASFLASRYSGSGHGTVMNWVIGNEINARNEWNYMQHLETAAYAKEYADAFRVFYNAILSVNGNARVYISLDQQWGKSLYSNNGYGSKEILDAFNSYLKEHGNIDWGMAYHPYNYPLTNPKAWSTSGKAGSYVLDSETTPVISIRNIHVLTDYLQKEEYLTEDGEVRHVILSEMGYTSSQGQDLQAASFIYAYKIIEANRYIDSLLFTRQTDAASEVAQGLALGINTLGGAHKSIYTAYKYIDTPQSAKYTDFALDVIGISSWSEVISQH